MESPWIAILRDDFPRDEEKSTKTQELDFEGHKMLYDSSLEECEFSG